MRGSSVPICICKIAMVFSTCRFRHVSLLGLFYWILLDFLRVSACGGGDVQTYSSVRIGLFPMNFRRTKVLASS